jgi:hypothetical protein
MYILYFFIFYNLIFSVLIYLNFIFYIIDKFNIFVISNVCILIYFLFYLLLFIFMYHYNLYCQYYYYNDLIIDLKNIYFLGGNVNSITNNTEITKLNYLKKAFNIYYIPYVDNECIHSFEHLINTINKKYYYFPIKNNKLFLNGADGVIYYPNGIVEYIQFKTFENKTYISINSSNNLLDRYQNYANILEIGHLQKNFDYQNSTNLIVKDFSCYKELADEEFKEFVDTILFSYKNNYLQNNYHFEFRNVNKYY